MAIRSLTFNLRGFNFPGAKPHYIQKGPSPKKFRKVCAKPTEITLTRSPILKIFKKFRKVCAKPTEITLTRSPILKIFLGASPQTPIKIFIYKGPTF